MKKMIKKTAIIFAAATIIYSQITFASAQDDTIKIGSLYELSGAVAAYGQTQANALQMAVDEINEAGGIDGKQVEVVSYDTKSEVSEASILTTRLVEEDQVDIIIGPATTAQMQAAIPVANAAGVTLISPSVTNNDILKDADGNEYEYVYRSSWPNAFQGGGLALFSADNLQAKKVVVIYDNSSDYGTGLFENFKSVYTGEIIEQTIVAGESDFSAMITNMMTQDFDAVVILSFYQTAGPIVKQMREFGIQTPIVGSNGFGNDIIYDLAGPENMNDVYYASLFPIKEDNSFVQAYVEKYKSKPDMFAALTYDTVYLVKKAIEETGAASREEINQAIDSIEEFSGITGDFVYDENHNPTKNIISMIEIQGAEEVAVHEIVMGE